MSIKYELIIYWSEEDQRELSTFARFFFETTLGSDFIYWALISIVPDTMIRMILATPPEAASPVNVSGYLFDVFNGFG